MMVKELSILFVFIYIPFFTHSQLDSLVIMDENRDSLQTPIIFSSIYGKFGYGNFFFHDGIPNYEGRTAGVGLAFNINRFQFGPELDFRYIPNRKFFKRYSIPFFKLHASYNLLTSQQHQLYLGTAIGTTFLDIALSARVNYSFMRNKNWNKSIFLLPELFIEYGQFVTKRHQVYVGFTHNEYFMKKIFSSGFRLSLVKKSDGARPLINEYFDND